MHVAGHIAANVTAHIAANVTANIATNARSFAILKWTLLAGASVAVDVCPCSRHPVLVLNVKCQFVFFVGVVVRLEYIGICNAQLLHEFRAVILRRFGRFLKHDVVAMQFDRDLMLRDAETPRFCTSILEY